MKPFLCYNTLHYIAFGILAILPLLDEFSSPKVPPVLGHVVQKPHFKLVRTIGAKVFFHCLGRQNNYRKFRPFFAQRMIENQIWVKQRRSGEVIHMIATANIYRYLIFQSYLSIPMRKSNYIYIYLFFEEKLSIGKWLH